MTRSFVLCLTGARRAPPRKVSLIFPDCFPGAQPDPVGEQWSAAAPGRRALWRRFSLRRFVLGRRPESGHIRERQIRLHRLQCRPGSFFFFFFILTPLKIITPTTLSWLRRDRVTVVLSCRTWWPPRSFTVTRRPRTSRWSPPPSMGWRRSPAESWWTPRMHCSPTQTTRWDTQEQGSSGVGLGGRGHGVVRSFDFWGLRFRTASVWLQVLHVQDLGINLSQNFTISWMWWRHSERRRETFTGRLKVVELWTLRQQWCHRVLTLDHDWTSAAADGRRLDLSGWSFIFYFVPVPVNSFLTCCQHWVMTRFYFTSISVSQTQFSRRDRSLGSTCFNRRRTKFVFVF